MTVSQHGEPAPAAALPMTRPLPTRVWDQLLRLPRWLAGYVAGNDPRVLVAWTPFLLLALILYTRHPATNCIFDEQEALLANPYVNASDGLTFWDAIHRDFWGLPPDASIGSYRPIPDMIWRATWSLHRHLPHALAHLPKHPFFHHLYNIAIHSLNAALLAAFAFAVTRRRAVGWIAGLAFLCSAVLTEAVTGVVGLADVLGGLGALLALNALRLPAWVVPPAVFAALVLGLFSKESALVCVPLLPVAAVMTAPMLHPRRPARLCRALLAFAGAVAAFVLYVELRKRWFPSLLPESLREPLPAGASGMARAYRDFLIWFHQAPLPKDPINNPLIDADFPHRVAGAMRVYWRGLVQLLFPLRLSGDYSFRQEPVPKTLHEWEGVAGAVMTVLPPLAGLGLWLRGLWRESKDRRALALVAPAPMRRFRPRLLAAGLFAVVAALSGLATELWLFRHGEPIAARVWLLFGALLALALGLLVEAWPAVHRPLPETFGSAWRYVLAGPVALGLVWIAVSYFPHSNIPVLLPTVRAERLWYFPAMGSSLALAALWAYAAERWPSRRLLRVASLPAAAAAAFFIFQSTRAYGHAMDYRDDLTFWHATKLAVPLSAKAHINYSVMIGARDGAGHMEERLKESLIAEQLAPKWPMAHVYTGDTLCRMHRAEEAWPHYQEGFDLGPNDKSLISLGLQCMYDEGILLKHEDELRAIVAKHPGNTWVGFLINDTLSHSEQNKGVDSQYRPRSYNQGAD